MSLYYSTIHIHRPSIISKENKWYFVDIFILRMSPKLKSMSLVIWYDKLIGMDGWYTLLCVHLYTMWGLILLFVFILLAVYSNNWICQRLWVLLLYCIIYSIHLSLNVQTGEMFNLFIGNNRKRKKRRKSIIETVKSSIEYLMRLICHERTKL